MLILFPLYILIIKHIASYSNNFHLEDSEVVNDTRSPTNNAKALSLRELYCQQIGNCLETYRRILLGRPRQEKGSLQCIVNKPPNCVKYANRYPKRSNDFPGMDKKEPPNESCLRKVSSTTSSDYRVAFTTKYDEHSEKLLKNNRFSNDSILSDTPDSGVPFFYKSSIQKAASRSQNSHTKSALSKRRNIGSRLSLIFSIEDMTTDSTSILKDSRHPSVSSITGKQFIGGNSAGMV